MRLPRTSIIVMAGFVGVISALVLTALTDGGVLRDLGLGIVVIGLVVLALALPGLFVGEDTTRAPNRGRTNGGPRRL